jgi:hypothetical protein
VSKNDEKFCSTMSKHAELFFFNPLETCFSMTEKEINGKFLQTHLFGDLRGRENGAEP